MAKQSKKKPTMNARLPWLYVIGGVVGLLSSFQITLDKIKLLSDPDFIPSCSLNPIFSCLGVMQSDQAEVFGFPNPILGLIGFTAVIVVGVSLLAGAKFPRWYWNIYYLGTFLGFIFCIWLFTQAVYDIGALCLWCMIVWAVTWPIFWYTTIHNLKMGNIDLPKSLQSVKSFIFKHHLDILLALYLVVLLLIIERFWYYWQTVAPFSWFVS